MNSESFKEFISSLKETDIEELKLETGETTLSFKRGNLPFVAEVPAAKVTAEKPVVEEKKDFPIKSPMVGTFFHSASSDHPPFVIEGNHVSPGSKVGIIETMKIMKDVTSQVKGKIVKVLVKNGEPVEYGQELFLVDAED